MNESPLVESRVPVAEVDPAPEATARFGRLRERTDELELFISGLLAFALLAVPGYLFDAWARSSLHTEGMYFQVLWFGFSISVGMCYVLAVALIAHLTVRGYWIGLIGLKSHFPKGIDWERLQHMGPVSRAFLKARDGGLDGSIERADRLATLLFSTTLLAVQTLAGTLVVAVLTLCAAMAISALAGGAERVGMTVVATVLTSLFALALVPAVLERAIARRQRRGQSSDRQQRWLQRFLGAMQRIPLLRLMQAMQLTLQSNLRSRSFMVAYLLAVMVAMVLGGVQVLGSLKFSLFNRYQVMTDEAVEHGMLSAHYESLRSAHDQLLPYPMIPSDTISGSRLRVFIPHRPQRDNPLARQHCTALPGARNEATGMQAANAAVECLSRLWQVQLDGTPVDLHDFMPMERRDLDMRGLVGYLPTAGLTPGRHDLSLVWNAEGGTRGGDRRREFRIPFWYAPDP
ncbi:efflux RND transporter permease subunit [Stenotrophomonas maltophilia]|uniref:efflux RND transporter permease subunit n=1 Tax=Stenotrophomonas TaxID=40323 RepID=UPI00201CBED5|nr:MULTISPECIES: efflux RND transporter permease subunit [Stenotrophomonas]MBN5025577.1 hypothetical protein [Stenotrophomonas maltophilia]MDH1272688.1 efflux RND transporter permease subunit [Stenotrophomonas sp. GD03937]MDH1484698.1 efflux RND transporter permease subunit [Stenotrophomonas sp. GD03712]UQY97620.1 efflux RND transporter permease subunit [Stenotrophomonas maltophilia]WON69910.1 efflux RND transporter permease subunit [Stenotrophomonas maltophilia]